jgi:hypothetical protein
MRMRKEVFFGTVVSKEDEMTLSDLAEERHVSVTTFNRDGPPLFTSVWVVGRGRRLASEREQRKHGLTNRMRGAAGAVARRMRRPTLPQSVTLAIAPKAPMNLLLRSDRPHARVVASTGFVGIAVFPLVIPAGVALGPGACPPLSTARRIGGVVAVAGWTVATLVVPPV